jgi:large subunit ribosomal protein L29
MTIEELHSREAEMRKEMFNLRFQAATGEIENPRRIRQVRKDIARLLTVSGEKIKAEGKEDK